MQVDWFTVVAQIVNFLILVWLLKHFLYGPITQAMTARQQRIAAALDEARRSTAQAEAEAREYQARQTELDARREEWLAQARSEVDARREEWLAQARSEVDARREEWLAAWRREQGETRHVLQREATRRLIDALRHALRELADADLETRMLQPLLTRLRALDAGERAALAQAGLGGCTLSTCFPLDPTLQPQWQAALEELFGTRIPLAFRQDPSSACGITLEMPGHRLAWTLDSYFDGFGQELARTLNGSKSTVVSGDIPPHLSPLPTVTRDDERL